MSIEKLAQFSWYKAEPSSPKEIADLFSIVDRSQADSKVESISRRSSLSGGVSPTDLAQIMKDLPVLQEQVRAWLKEVHPEHLTHAAK